MYSKEFESKIKRYVGNGNITPQQRKELHEEAEKYKIDDEELDIVIDGYIYLAQHQMLDNATAYRVDSQKQKIDKPSVEYPTDDGFNFKDFIQLIIHNKWARLLAIAVLIVVFFPVIAVLLLGVVSLFQPSSETEKSTTRTDSTEIVVNTPDEADKNTTDSNEQADSSMAEKSTNNNDDNSENDISEADDSNENDDYDTGRLKFVAKEASARELVHQDIVGMSKNDLRILRNWLYAKHGYIFKSADLRNYFNNMSWYAPKYTDVTSRLSKVERRNVQFIKCYEEE